MPISAARVLGIVPARLGSERLPRKPLYSIAGRPLIEWVWARVSTFTAVDAWVIATDAEAIADVCGRIGAPVVMTSPAHGSGTERVAEVAERDEYRGFDWIVNVQGDEPFIDEAHVRGALDQVRAGWDIGTVATPVGSLEALRDPAVVKVVRRDDGSALYFSRAPIPFRRDGDPSVEELGRRSGVAGSGWERTRAATAMGRDERGANSEPGTAGAGPLYLRHLGIYAYTAASLRRWVSLPPHDLERTERLEQLRPLAAGMTIGVGDVAEAENGVDTPEDARRAELRLHGVAQATLGRNG